MAQSMTGFGVAEGGVQDGRLRVEVRSVNHRHLSLNIKLSDELQPVETDVRDAIRGRFGRGHVTLSARWSERPTRVGSVHVNVDRAREVLAAVRELQTALSLNGGIDVTFIARHPDVLSAREAPVEVTWAEIAPIVEQALTAAANVRAREGATLTNELRSIVGALEGLAAEVKELAPARLDREHRRLRTAIEKLVDGVAVDETRIAQELAISTDRLDITEEIVRLGAHLVSAHRAVDGDGPVGKELGFLAQEILREVNTIGSKANDVDITKRVIGMKGEIEKFREQVENVE